jgi:probable HAF family extracellular repeat protein
LPAGSSAAFGIADNLLGQVVGVIYDANSNGEAALWNKGKLSLLAGIPGGNFSQAEAINIRGEIVGTSQDASGITNAVLWRHGVLTVLATNAVPGALNDENQVLWRSDVAINLNDQIAQGDPLKPYVTLHGAGGINNFDQIVASGTDARSPATGQAYLLTPVR